MEGLACCGTSGTVNNIGLFTFSTIGIDQKDRLCKWRGIPFLSNEESHHQIKNGWRPHLLSCFCETVPFGMEAKEEDDIVTCLVVLTVKVSLVEDFSRVAVPPFRCSKSGVTAATFAFPNHLCRHFPSTQFSEIITGFCGAKANLQQSKVLLLQPL